jgi:hypothetical protein
LHLDDLLSMAEEHDGVIKKLCGGQGRNRGLDAVAISHVTALNVSGVSDANPGMIHLHRAQVIRHSRADGFEELPGPAWQIVSLAYNNAGSNLKYESWFET